MLFNRLAATAARTSSALAHLPSHTAARQPTPGPVPAPAAASARPSPGSRNPMAESGYNPTAISDKLGDAGVATRAEKGWGLTRADLAAGASKGPLSDERAVQKQLDQLHLDDGVVGDKQAHSSAGDGSSFVVASSLPGARSAAGYSAEGSASSASSASKARGPTAYLGASDGQGKRDHMEDRHTLIPDFRPPGAEPGLQRQFVAVYDGHASHKGSEHASQRVHKFIAAQPAIQKCKGDSCDHSAVEAALKAAFKAADEEIVGEAVAKGKRYGTTAVCALRLGYSVYVAHAGDSRAVLCRDGRGVTLTEDHKPASVPQERERIEAQGGIISYDSDRVLSNPEGQRQSRLNMSRALGDPDFKEPRRLVEAEPDVARVQLRPGSDSFLLLGSDGLFDVMSAQQAVEIAAEALAAHKGGPSDAAAEAAADALVQRALKAGTRDNVTALLMLLDWNA